MKNFLLIFLCLNLPAFAGSFSGPPAPSLPVEIAKGGTAGQTVSQARTNLKVGDLIPGYRSQNWYGVSLSGATTTAVGAQNTLYALPMPIYETVTIDALAFRVTTSGSGSVARVGIYDSTGTGGRPGTLVAQGVAEQTTTASNSNVTFTLSPAVTLAPDVYWLASLHSWSGSAPSVTGPGTTAVSTYNALTGSTTVQGAVVSASSSMNGAVTGAAVYGSLPVSFGTATEVNGGTAGMPTIVMRAQ